MKILTTVDLDCAGVNMKCLIMEDKTIQVNQEDMATLVQKYSGVLPQAEVKEFFRQVKVLEAAAKSRN